MGLVDGKVALVTGAGSGIGEHSARLFAAEGASVVVADLNGDAAMSVARAIVDLGGTAIGVQADVTNEQQVIAMVTATIKEFGRLDCAHNNAGISGTMTAFTDLSLDDWNHMIAINLTSVFLSMKHEIPAMLASGGGAIVNTSSGAGVVGFAGLPHYVAAKHGVVGLTKTAALEFAKSNIRVNAVLPGTTNTPMIQEFTNSNPDIGKMIARSVGRGSLGQPEEIAQAAVWLCSDRASFVSGDSMLVDGATVCR
ncbi:MAG: glucose 1-dehydrogenase [Ilumatobacteraceae bacterium]|nr:glucose 1-dehydrogenase [Ilumatobacteraceae bacterium]MBJ7369757.1 glucose 1-dehydrogenase [Ilumatobacteraceae bacterium]